LTFECLLFPRSNGFLGKALPTAEDAVFTIDSGDASPCFPGAVIEICSALHSLYTAGDGSIVIFRSMPANSLVRQVTLRQQQPVVTCMLDQASAGLHQPLLQAGERHFTIGAGSASRRHKFPRL